MGKKNVAQNYVAQQAKLSNQSGRTLALPYCHVLLCVAVCFRLKDGVAAAEKCSRYHRDGSSLVIRDVTEDDAGVYTVLAGIQKFGLYQNITVSLVVNGKANMFPHATCPLPPTPCEIKFWCSY